MTLRRSDIVGAVTALAAGLTDIFPPTIDVDSSDLGEMTAVDGQALTHTANLVSGRFEVTLDGGSQNAWEGVRSMTLTYAVGGERGARVARRDLAVPALEVALAQDRTLGLGDPQVWAELGSTDEDDDAPVPDTASVSLAHIDINVTYVAASAAG